MSSRLANLIDGRERAFVHWTYGNNIHWASIITVSSPLSRSRAALQAAVNMVGVHHKALSVVAWIIG